MDFEGGNGGGGQGGGEAAGSADDLLGGGAGGGDAGGEGQGGGGEGQAGGGGQGGGQGGGEIVDPDWYQQISADPDGDNPSLRDWVKANKATDINGLAKIARDNQRALRESGRIKVPGEGATAEETAAFRKAIGVPDDAKGYTMPTVMDAKGKPVELNSGKLDAIAAIAHEEGIPKAALERTLQRIAEGDAQDLATSEAAIQARAEAHAKTWGAQRAEKTAAIGNAAKALGLTRAELLSVRAAWGPERALDVFARLGAGISEDTLIEGGGGGGRTFGLSGAEAQKTLDTRSANREWLSKALVPGTPENAEYRRLNDAIGAAADRKANEAA